MKTRTAAFFSTTVLLAALLVYAQGDFGGDYGGDPGYSVYGDTSPYPLGDEPLPELGSSSQGAAPAGFNTGAGFPGFQPTPMPSGFFSNPASGYTMPSSGDQAARGNYEPYLPAPDANNTPIITRPQSNPFGDIPDWVNNLGPSVSQEDFARIQELFQERSQLEREAKGSPGQDAVQTFLDAFGAGRMPDSVPLAEERHQQNIRIGEINQELQQKFDENNIIASPYSDEKPSGLPQAQAADNENYNVHTSDSAPNGTAGAGTSHTPFDWTAGWEKNFQDSLSPLDFQAVTGNATGPADPGGIDFRSVRWVYLSETSFAKPGAWDAKSFACGMQAIRSNGKTGIHFQETSRLVSNAFFVLLAIPDRDLWVNLHPTEPDRIISSSLGRTDVGRIMLEADFQLKRDAGRLMKTEPFASAERHLVQSIFRRHLGAVPASSRWGSSGRVEISSATSQVFARDTVAGIFIEGVVLDVVFEQKSLFVAAGGSASGLEVSPEEWKEFLRLTEKWIRPRLIRRVNRAPEYEALRQVFSARVLSDWYKRRSRTGGSLAPLIDQGRLDGLTSASPWDPRLFWQRFKRDYETGATRGYGGVNLQRMPAFQAMPSGPGAGPVLLAQALVSRGGSWRRGVYRSGRAFLAITKPSDVALALRWGVTSIFLAALIRSLRPGRLLPRAGVARKVNAGKG